MTDLLNWLQGVFADDLSNGSWEHGKGISIETLDNPGWKFSIYLEGTDLENIPFSPVKVEEDENHWYVCRVNNEVFEGFGGPGNLIDILGIFQKWYIDSIDKGNLEKN